MKQSFEKLFVTATKPDPVERLCSAVMGRIERRETARARIYAGVFGLLTAAVVVGFIPAIGYLATSFIRSGFGQYLSLFASDGSYVMSHWQDTLMSVADTLPVTAAAIVVALAMAGLASLRLCAQGMSSLRISTRIGLTAHLS